MKHAVIFAHPKPDSFTAAMADAYADAARRQGQEVVVRDLYAMNFDPRLQAAEMAGDEAPIPLPDVAAERELLKDVDVFVLVYPLWFNAPPAMLKGYLERVFGMGFGYGRTAGRQEPLLTGRKLLSITASGAPADWIKDTGSWRAIRRLFDEHFAEVCGLEVLDHLHFGEITHGIRDDAVRACRRAVPGSSWPRLDSGPCSGGASSSASCCSPGCRLS